MAGWRLACLTDFSLAVLFVSPDVALSNASGIGEPWRVARS
jgi:hypothetical protein